MATGRTASKYMRVYMDGVNVSGYSRSIGPLRHVYDEANVTADYGDDVKRYLSNMASIGVGTLNGVFDNDAAGLYALAHNAGVARTIMVPIGIRAAPAQGDPVFCSVNVQNSYGASDDAGAVMATAEFGEWHGASLAGYDRPWGTLLHAPGAETAANTATGVDDWGATTAFGGYMMYQIFASSVVSCTIKVQHADTNSDGSFSDLGGCTVNAVTVGAPSAGIVATTAPTTSVKRYLRWQITIGGTSVNFTLAFVRGIR